MKFQNSKYQLPALLLAGFVALGLGSVLPAGAATQSSPTSSTTKLMPQGSHSKNNLMVAKPKPKPTATPAKKK